MDGPTNECPSGIGPDFWGTGLDGDGDKTLGRMLVACVHLQRFQFTVDSRTERNGWFEQTETILLKNIRWLQGIHFSI